MISSHALSLSFIAALIVHGGVVVCVGLFGSHPVYVRPDFSYQSGESATKITIVPARASRAQQASVKPKQTPEQKFSPHPQPNDTTIARDHPTTAASAMPHEPVILLIAKNAYTLPVQPRASPRTLAHTAKQKTDLRPPAPAQPQATKSSINSRETLGDLRPKGVKTMPRPLAPIKLSYPAEAEMRREVGRTKVQVTLLASGRVGSVRLLESSGNLLLDQAVVQSYQAARFHPILENGIPVEYTFKASARFHIPVAAK